MTSKNIANSQDDPQTFERAIRKESELIDHSPSKLIHSDLDTFTTSDLQSLNLTSLHSPPLEHNPTFLSLRSKLVSFLRRYERFRETQDPKALGMPGSVMTGEQWDQLKIRRTLYAGVKRLMRVVIVTEDPVLQVKYLNKLQQWYQIRENAMQSVEAAQAAKLRQEQLLKKAERDSIVRDQHAMTYLPPLRSHSSVSKNRTETKAQKHATMIQDTINMSEVQYIIEQQRKSNAAIQSAQREEESLVLNAFRPRQSTIQKNTSPMKTAKTPTKRIVKKAEGDEEGQVRPSTPTEKDKEIVLRIMKQSIVDKEIKQNLDSIKKGWTNWSLVKKNNLEDLNQIHERAIYGSHFQKLGAQSKPLLQSKGMLTDERLEWHNVNMLSAVKQTQLAKLKMKLLGLNGKTTHDFINEATSSEGGTGPYEDLHRHQDFRSKTQLRKDTTSSQDDEDSSSSLDPLAKQQKHETTRNRAVTHSVTAIKQVRHSLPAAYKPNPHKKVVDLTFEEIQNQLNASLNFPQTAVMPSEATEAFASKMYQLKAQHMLNMGLGESQLRKAASKRRIESLRRLQREVLYPKQQPDADADNLNDTQGSIKMPSVATPDPALDDKDVPRLFESLNHRSADIMSLSVFNRPLLPSAAQLAYTNKQFDDNYQYLSMTSLERQAGAAFNPRLSMENRKKIQQAQLEVGKTLKKGGGASPAQKQAPKKPQPVKKGAPVEEKKPIVEKTTRILEELPSTFKAENYDLRTSQYLEVEGLKQHLAQNNLNVSADIIRKAIVFPEDAEGLDQPLGRLDISANIERRHYPRVCDILMVNPFAKPKKGKKGKKGKKK
ncbi:hypothetical protein FGO68_gene11 [Halteria grandinella]|uniref:Uncharacterized protein n=1 Tax=Halteria grandinella TaxID=5974 RepID=A0A8J8NZW7_HALGN|nr:hypothetical protein FGO68_gene11 [Halteria grandinella]